MLSRSAPVAPCASCNEQIARVGGGVLLLVCADRPDVVLKAELLHQRCAGARQLAPGERSQVFLVSDLAADAAARERLRQLARTQLGPVAGALIRVLQVAFRESVRSRSRGAGAGAR